MKEHVVKILMTEFVTHDVKRFVLEKPTGFKFIPGQACDVSINNKRWREDRRPFTFTCLNSDLVLEFTIKRYDSHNGMTKALHALEAGDELILWDVFGTINYKGKGVFIAAGAGITPFIEILRDLKKKGKSSGNKLIFSNKTADDVILEGEFRDIFDEKDLIFTLTREEKEGYEYGRIDREFLKKNIKDFKQNFYICGPDEFVKAVKEDLETLGARVDSAIFEK